MVGGIRLKSLSVSQKDEQVLEVRESVLKTLSFYGLDAPEWNNAISSQYFLVKLAKELSLTQRADFMSLFDRFLSSFRFRHDDSIDSRIRSSNDNTRRDQTNDRGDEN